MANRVLSSVINLLPDKLSFLILFPVNLLPPKKSKLKVFNLLFDKSKMRSCKRDSKDFGAIFSMRLLLK